MTEYLDKWDGDIIRALRFQDEEICELAADEIERLRAALEALLDDVDGQPVTTRVREQARAALAQEGE
jgi:hypothetical protein